jgi:hypothetical protein
LLVTPFEQISKIDLLLLSELEFAVKELLLLFDLQLNLLVLENLFSRAGDARHDARRQLRALHAKLLLVPLVGHNGVLDPESQIVALGLLASLGNAVGN